MYTLGPQPKSTIERNVLIRHDAIPNELGTGGVPPNAVIPPHNWSAVATKAKALMQPFGGGLVSGNLGGCWDNGTGEMRVLS